MATYEVTTEKGRERIEGEYCREEHGNALIIGNYEPLEIVRRFGNDEWYYYRLSQASHWPGWKSSDSPLSAVM